jgi:hypothetical protein
VNRSVRTSLAIIVSLLLCGAAEDAFAHTAGGAMRQMATRQAATLSRLTPELAIPPALPAGLEDPTLLEAWVRLYDHTEQIALWGSTTTSGRALAQVVMDQAIPLAWDVQGVCRSGSCSRQFCAEDACGYEDGQPGVDPIYIYPPHAAQMATLVATLAHESFHRLQPFGPVHDSRFEEFWACRLSAAFDPHSGFRFDGYDPLVSGYLVLWIRDNGLAPYYALPDYPDGFEPAAVAARP